MDTPKLSAELAKRIDEIGKIPDPIERSDATSELLTVIDRARAELAAAYSR